MADFAGQKHMTDVLSIPKTNLVRTVPGMAHFAGTGPAEATCSGCAYWQKFGRRSLLVCMKYRQMTGDAGKAIPADAPACRHFSSRMKDAA